MPAEEKLRLNYRDSGVDIERAQKAKERIKQLARSTFTSAVLGDIGSFAGLYRPDLSNLTSPILASTVDGVGTKLKIAFLSGIHNTIGIDLVAHCTNDILAQKALPLLFLDYIGMGKLQTKVVEQIVEGLTQGCKQANCALIGGETAEMPGFYRQGEYDLVGFMIGITDELKLAGSDQIEEGDILIGLPSSGLHTNGYSLVRKLFFEQEQLHIDSYIGELEKTIGEELLTPHRNYLPLVKKLILTDDLRSLAHITGGGITDNLPRILDNNTDAVVHRGTWETLPIFHLIQERGKVATQEMYRTFNMGLGMILIVTKERVDRVQQFLTNKGEKYYLVGEITKGTGRVRYV